jgi:hypothetical protein
MFPPLNHDRFFKKLFSHLYLAKGFLEGFFQIPITLTLLIALACGSSGGGGSSASSILSTYSGSTEQVTLNISNAKAIITDMISSDVSTSNLKPESNPTFQTFPSATHLSNIIKIFNLKTLTNSTAPSTQATNSNLSTTHLPQQPQQHKPQQKTITITDDKKFGAVSGHVIGNGTVDDETGDASLSLNYQSYSADGRSYLTGSATYSQSGSEVVYTFNDMTYREGIKSMFFTGTFVFQFNLNAGTSNGTTNFVATDTATGIMTVHENMIESGSLTSPFYKVLSGTIYHGVHGYLNVRSISDLDTSNLNTGTMLYSGKNSQVQLAQNSMMLLDADGDGVYETTQSF